MSLTRIRLRVAVRVMRYYNSVPLTGAMPVMAPFRGGSNHQFTAGRDFIKYDWRSCPQNPLKAFSIPSQLKTPVSRISYSDGQRDL